MYLDQCVGVGLFLGFSLVFSFLNPKPNWFGSIFYTRKLKPNLADFQNFFT